MSNSLFRKKLFGGLNSMDVEEYIRNLEHEIESVKVLHQKEKNELLKKVEQYEENSTAGTLDSELHKQAEEMQQQLEQLKKEKEELREANSLLEKEKDNLEGLIRKAENSQSGDSNGWEEQLIRLQQENDELKKQVRKQEEEISEQKSRIRSEGTTEEKQADTDVLFDYSTVSKIIEDANRNADAIREEAKEDAARILAEADKEVERKKVKIASKVNSQLEEKGIQLMAAKYKIEQYVKEIDSLQQGMYTLYSRMNNLVNDMPVRLDDYWEGEHYEMLESRRLLGNKKEKSEGKTDQEDKTVKEKESAGKTEQKDSGHTVK